MLKLIENELIKIFKRKNTYILLLIGLIVITSYNIFIKLTNTPQDITKQYESAYKRDTLLLENYNTLNIEDSYEDIIERIALEKYAIDNNIQYNIMLNSTNKNISIPIDARILLMKIFDNFEIVLIFFIVYFSTTILSEEYVTGTIKNLLTKPHKRVKILLSKLTTLILVTIILLFFIILFQIILGGMFFGFDSYSLEAIIYNKLTQNIDVINLSFYMLTLILCKIPMYLLLILIGLLVGVITNNIALNILISLGIYIISTMNFLINKASKYFFIFYWDISKFLFDIKKIENAFTISIISIMIFFMLLCCIFKNRDMKNV